MTLTKRPLTIVQVNTRDRGGGAEKVAYQLHHIFRERGHRSILVVGRKLTDDPDVLLLDNVHRWKRRYRWKNFLEERLGWQYLNYPGSHVLMEQVGRSWDILLLHNLHGDYFDLGALPALSKRAPTIIMLHDMWLLTGHCAHPLKCQRWRAGCGRCPDLTLYPSIPTDGARFNWWRKRRLLQHSRLLFTAPSLWLLKQISSSHLNNKPTRLIRNGVDLTIFKPDIQAAARHRLGLLSDRPIILFSASQGLRNPWKHGETVLQATRQLQSNWSGPHRPLLVVVGGQEHEEDLGFHALDIRFVPFVSDDKIMAAYYQAADVMAYATRADNCPLVILEALACGLPVVASAVGGVPELIDEGKTGFLVPPGDPTALEQALKRIISNSALAHHMRQCAADTARQRFDIQRQADEHLAWYDALVTETNPRPQAATYA